MAASGDPNSGAGGSDEGPKPAVIEREHSSPEDDELEPKFVPANRLQVDEPVVASGTDAGVFNSVVQMHPDDMEALDIFADDVIRIKGRMKRVSAAVVQESEEIHPGSIGVGTSIRHNLRLRPSDFCTVKPSSHVQLKTVNVALIDTAQADGVTGDVYSTIVQPYFASFPAPGRPVCAGDVFQVPWSGKRLTFIITEVAAKGAVEEGAESDWGIVDTTTPPTRGPEGEAIRQQTDIILAPDRMPETEGLKSLNAVSYSDIGGLKKQIGQIREMIELPLRLPKLFRTIGVKPPKGVLMSGPPGCGKTLIAKAIANEVGAYFFSINGPDIVAPMAGQSESNLRKAFQDCEDNAPAILFIDEIDAIAPNRDKVQDETMRRIVATLLTCMDGLKGSKQVMVLAATNRPNALDPALRRAGRFDSEIAIPVPDRAARLEILEILTIRKGMKLKPFDKKLEEEHPGHPDNQNGVDLDRIADMTHGYVGADLTSLCTKAALATVRDRAPTLIDLDEKEVPVEFIDQLYVTMQDFLNAAKGITPSGMRDVAVTRPNTKFADIGGLDAVKQELREMIELPIKHGSLFEKMGITAPQGALLYGPPGCGKTLLAKAIANECECNFISIKGPQLHSKWFGESEENVRDIFNKARQSSPCVIFFDEMDSIASKRGGRVGGSNPADRVVNQLLTEMDGMGKRKQVFIIGATNFLDNLDPAVLRTGRLDQFIYVGLPEGEEGCRHIVNACLRKTRLDSRVNMDSLARWSAEQHLTGADIAGLCKRAVKMSVSQRIAAEKRGDDTSAWALGPDCIESAARETRPTVSEAKRAEYLAHKEQHKVQLTTEATAGDWEGHFVIPEGDPRRARQDFGTIDQPKEDKKKKGKAGEGEEEAGEAGAGESKEQEDVAAGGGAGQ